MHKKRTIRSTKPVFATKLIADRVKQIADDVNRDYDGEELILVSVLTGALVFTADLLRWLKGPSRVWLEAVKAPPAGASAVEAKFDLIADGLHPNARVLIIEDMIETGRTFNAVVQCLLDRRVPLAKIAAAVLVRKADPHGKRALLVEPKYVAFDDDPPRKLVGFGMSYEGVHRNKRDIHEHLYEIDEKA